jgi:hypothetical protein
MQRKQMLRERIMSMEGGKQNWNAWHESDASPWTA